MYFHNNELPPQQGWICPKCGRVNAPWMPTCGCVSSQTSGTSTPYLVKTPQKSRDSHEIADTPQTDCDTCIWNVCNYNKVEWDADTPQKELTAKCLNCHNAKACKEKHWDGCIYEPQTDYDDIYPLVIIEDRYTGVYSNGKYTAWNMYFEDIPREIDEDDVTCRNFWHSYDGIVGLGETPNDAIQDLRKMLNSERNEK